MLTLASRDVSLKGVTSDKRSIVVRLRNPEAASPDLSPHDVFIWSKNTAIQDGRIYCVFKHDATSLPASNAGSFIVLPNEMDFLEDGDVLAIDTLRPSARVLYRRNSLNNSFLLTERCNHFCLMCSQPPKDINDDWIVDEIIKAIPLLSPDTREIGFTGGEPTLLGARFLDLVRSMKTNLPNTGLHILTNGKRFADIEFARQYAAISHHDAMLGIPIYSASSQSHDFIVQADGAFDETIRGILNLKRFRQLVEIRVVIHRENYRHLQTLSEFIARNLTFVDYVALMGLEVTGFVKANLDQLWIDPFDYRAELYDAASLLSDAGLRTSIYNHQLCTIDHRIWPLAVKSISDWKNEYRSECAACAARDKCGGFFATGRLRQSAHIKPVTCAVFSDQG
jgi:His-Xaa-Ser system radical SAM maturase HxsC